MSAEAPQTSRFPVLRRILRTLTIPVSVAVLTLSSATAQTPSQDEEITLRVYWAWRQQHSDIFDRYGAPDRLRFVSIHDQFFQLGHVTYNVTDSQAIVFYGRRFLAVPTPENMTPGSARQINEAVFSQATSGLTEAESKSYRDLIDARIKSADFMGVGIIGGIATLYIEQRLLLRIGKPEDNERLIPSALHVKGQNYELVVGLRLGAGGGTDEQSPRSVYLLFPNGDYQRHVVWPARISPAESRDFQELFREVKEGASRTWFGAILARAGRTYRQYKDEPWFWPLSALAGLIATYVVGLVALIVLASRQGTVVFSRSLLTSLAAKFLLATPLLGRWILFLGYRKRLAKSLEISPHYFGLPAEGPNGLTIPPDATGQTLHGQIANALGPKQPVVIVGRGGAGKTTLLERLALMAVRRELPKQLRRFWPVLVPKDYYDTSLVKAISDVLRERYRVAIDETVTQSQLESGRVLVLFDGLSEIQGDRTKSIQEIIRTAQNSEYERSRFLLASRPIEGLSTDLAAFHLQPLTQENIRQFLSTYGLDREREAKVRQQLDAFGSGSVEPLLLAMAVSSSSDQTSATRAHLYEKYFRHLLRLRGGDTKWFGWRYLLEQFANWFFLSTGRRGAGVSHTQLIDLMSNRNVSETSFFDRLQSSYRLPADHPIDLLERLKSAGILDGDRRWRFAHDTFEEYFSASYIVARLEEDEQNIHLHEWMKSPEQISEFVDVIDFVREMASPKVCSKILEMQVPDTWKDHLKHKQPSQDTAPVIEEAGG